MMFRDSKLIFVTLAFSLLLTCYQTVQQYVTVFYDEVGDVSVGYIGLFLGFLFFFLGSLISPVFVSRFGATRCFLLASGFYVLFALSLGEVSNALFYMISSLLGLAASALWAGHFVYMGRISSDAHRGRNAGFFWGVYSAATGIGLVASGTLINILSYRQSFLIYAGIGVVGVLFFVKILDRDETVMRDQKWSDQLPLLSSPTAFLMSLTIFATYLLYGLMVSIVPLDIDAVMGTASVGTVSALFFIIPTVTSFHFGFFADRVGRAKAVGVGFCAVIVGTFCLYSASEQLALIGGIVIATLGFSMLNPVMTALPMDIAPTGFEVRMCGTFNAMGALGIALGAFAPFMLEGKTGYLAVGIVIVIVGVLIARLIRLPVSKIRERVARDLSMASP